MSFVGVFGILLGLSSAHFAVKEWTWRRVAIFALTYLLHIACCFAYYTIVQNSPADSALYYFDELGYYQLGFGLSTRFIVYIVQSMREILGGSYLDYFLLFQAIGYWGIAIMMRTFQDIHDDLGARQSFATYAILFFPSLHYWSSAIGKDGPFLFSLALGLWALMALHRRLAGLLVAFALMLMIRPHVAFLALAALAVTILIGRGTKLHVRIFLFTVAVAGVAYAVSTVQSTFQMDLTNSETISDVLEARTNVLETEDAGQSRVDASFPIRLLSLLFKPFFFDTQDSFGLIVSIENAALLSILCVIVYSWSRAFALFRSVTYVRYAMIYAGLMIAFLALTYYNVGLGLRQKWTMLMPALLVIYASLVAIRRARRGYLTDPAAGFVPIRGPA